MARLIVEKGHDKGTSVSLLPRGATVFGRDTTANVQIKDTMASRLHFKIEPRADGLWLVDLQSMNGTLLNGHPATESKLNTGDLIRVGETMYSFLPDDAGADPLLGQRLGGYKILERVGRGGMGTVYKAEQIDLQRIVALKIISEEHLKNPEFVELFVHEARAAAKLNHPNIVQVYDVKKTNELYYFSMEFVPGGSVQDLLNTRRKIPIDDSVRMILEAARGLEYAHRKEIIHRDVKPDNFMIGEGASIKIGDLGLAQRLGEKLSADNEDSVIGTPHYIAPEQLLGKPADVRSDVYSLGSTMYRMIAGFTPFQAPSIRDLVNKKAREEAVPLHAALGGIPESLGAICARMMARLPEERTPTMSAVIADLEAWTRGSNGDGDARETAPVNRKLLVTAVGLLAVVVIGGVIAATTMMGKGDGRTTAAPSAPVTVADEGSPETKLDRAVIEESRLVDQKPDEFDDVIRQYDAIVSRWPDTAWGKDASRRGEALKSRRVGLMAARGVAALEDLDREAWKALLVGFQAGREDLAEADKRERDYRAFADDPAWKGTEASITAGRRAALIATWKAEVEKRRAGYGTLREAAEKGISERRHREAWEACNEFIAELATYAPPVKDRYATLLFDAPARRLQDRIVDEASRGLDAAAKEAADLESKGDFAGAVAALDAATRHSLKEPAERGRKLLQELQDRWSAANRLAAERAAAEQRKLADLDRRDFDAAARRWREHVLRFDPKAALADAQSIARTTPDRFPRLAAAEARIASRIVPLRTLAEFKESLLKAWNDKAISNRITLGVLTGPIVRATDTHITVDFGSGSQGETSFADILAGGTGSSTLANFLDYLRAAGKKGDPRWSMGLTILCLELGLYERAGEDLQNVEKSADPVAKKFAADWRTLVEDLRYPDSDEIEAQKHYDRLLLALKDPPASPRFDIGRTLELLRTRFGGTETYLAQKARLDEIEKGKAELGVKERDRGAREKLYGRIRALRMKTQGDSRMKEGDTLKGLGTLRDPIERCWHVGEAHLGFGNLKASNAALIEAFELAYRKCPPADKRGPVDTTANWVCRAGASLLRNFHLMKQERSAAEVRNKIDLKFADGGDYAPWTGYKAADDAWSLLMLERIKKHGERLAPLEKELQENPDPKVLYELAEAHDVLRNAMDARGLYVALLQEFPEFEKSRSPDTLYRLAEMTFQLRDVETAETLYTKMKTDFPMHPKVVQTLMFDSVESRLRTCTFLKNNMGPSK